MIMPDRRNDAMAKDCQPILDALRAHEAELRERGVASLSLFGSIARGEDEMGSDVDIALRLADEDRLGGFEYFGRIEDIRLRLGEILGREVDVVAEPIRKPSLHEHVERDRVLAF